MASVLQVVPFQKGLQSVPSFSYWAARRTFNPFKQLISPGLVPFLALKVDTAERLSGNLLLAHVAHGGTGLKPNPASGLCLSILNIACGI